MAIQFKVRFAFARNDGTQRGEFAGGGANGLTRDLARCCESFDSSIRKAGSRLATCGE